MDEDELEEQDFDSYEDLIEKLQNDANKSRAKKAKSDEVFSNKQKRENQESAKLKKESKDKKVQTSKTEEKKKKDYIEVKDYEEPSEDIHKYKNYKRLKIKLLLIAMGVIAIDGYLFSKLANKEVYPKEEIEQAKEQIEYCEECGYKFENLSDDETIEGIILMSELANSCSQDIYESYETTDSYEYFSNALSLVYLEKLYEEEDLSEEKIEDYNNLAYGAIFVYDENEDNRLLNDDTREYIYVMQESIGENIKIKEEEERQEREAEQVAEEEARQAELLKKQVQNVISNIESKFDYEFSFLSEDEIIDRVTKLSEWLNNQTQESFIEYYDTSEMAKTNICTLMNNAFGTTNVLDNYYSDEDGKVFGNFRESMLIVGAMVFCEDAINNNELLNDTTREWLLNINIEELREDFWNDVQNRNGSISIYDENQELENTVSDLKEKQKMQIEENIEILDDGDER